MGEIATAKRSTLTLAQKMRVSAAATPAGGTVVAYLTPDSAREIAAALDAPPPLRVVEVPAPSGRWLDWFLFLSAACANLLYDLALSLARMIAGAL